MTAAAPIQMPLSASIEPEQSLLAAILISVGKDGVDQAIRIVSPEDFFYPKTRLVFSAMVRLAGGGVDIDLLTIATELDQSGDLVAAGGKEYLMYLIDNIPAASNIEYFAQKIKTNSNLRRLRSELLEGVRLCETRADEDTIPDIHEGLNKTIKKMGGRKAGFEIMTFGDIRKADPQLEIVIDGLLEKKGALMVIGPGGIGKSLFVNTIALTCGLPASNPTSGSLWGLFKIPKQMRTLIVQSENGLAATNQRISKMIGEDPDLATGLESVATLKSTNDIRISGDFEDAGFMQKLRISIKAFKADIVIFDPLISFHSNDENKSAEMRQSLDALSALQDEIDFAAVIIHHTGKGDKDSNFPGRGASGIGDWNSSALSFSHTEDRTAVAVEHQKSRNFPYVSNFFLERTEGCRVVRMLDTPQSEVSRSMAATVTALKNLGGVSNDMNGFRAEIQLTLKKEGLKKTVRAATMAMEKAVEFGVVIRSSKKGHRTLYKLAGGSDDAQ